MGKGGIQGPGSSRGRKDSDASTSINVVIGIGTEMIMNILNSPREYSVSKQGQQHCFSQSDNHPIYVRKKPGNKHH